jgi:hypothetical protein
MSHRDERERRAEEFCQWYLSFWGFVCLGCVFVFGWPVLLAWLGAAWFLTTFLQLLLGHGNDSSQHRSRRPPCSKHR